MKSDTSLLLTQCGDIRAFENSDILSLSVDLSLDIATLHITRTTTDVFWV